MNKKLNRTGIIAGLLMALVMSALSITGNYEIGIIKYLKYLVLVGFLIKTGLEIKNAVPTAEFFQKAMAAGFRVSIWAGLILATTTLFLFAVNPAFAPMKFNLMPQDLLQAFTIAIMLLIETFALGIIINFAVIQALKPGAETVNQ